MKTILFPTDFSDCARNALNHAIGYARLWNARLILAHAYPPPTTDLYGSEAYSVDIVRQMKEDANKALESLGRILTEDEKFDAFEIYCEMGYPVDSVAELAKEKKASLVVMGTKGADSSLRRFFGTNATQVIEEAPVPVLAVPQDAHFRPLQKIAYAADLKNLDLYSISQLLQIARPSQAHISFIHIAGLLTVEHKLRIENLFASLQETLNYPHLSFHLLEDPNRSEALLDFLNQNPMDVVALTPHKRNLLERLFRPSFTRNAALDTHTPLLALRTFE